MRHCSLLRHRDRNLKVAGAFGAICLSMPVLAHAQVQFRGAEYIEGELPPTVPPSIVGGGEVALEVSVGAAGSVTNVKVLRSTPPYTDALAAAVRTWRFRPAERLTPPRTSGEQPRWQPVPTRVLVAEFVSPPVLLGPTIGEVPKDVAHESDDTPFPMGVAPLRYPPLALGDGTVLVREAVGVDGRVTDARVVRPWPGFDASALEVARAVAFRPARLDGFTVPANAFLLFMFRAPVTPVQAEPR